MRRPAHEQDTSDSRQASDRTKLIGVTVDRRAVIALSILLTLPTPAGCNSKSSPSQTAASPLPIPVTKAYLIDVSKKVGIDFERNANNPESYFMPHIIGSGCALFDFDNDGRLDVYLVQSGPDPGSFASHAPNPRARNRLFQQQSDGSFRDVTALSGLGDEGYGMGVAVGDIDNDGDLDVFVTNYGPDRLYQNNGDGSFADVTSQAGINNSRWSTSATLFDYNGDGWLDLFVVNYLDYFRQLRCLTHLGTNDDFCSPKNFAPTTDRLYRNNGRGKSGDSTTVTFSDVTHETGIVAAAGPGLGVICADFTGDHRPDIYVANDGRENFLWINQPDGTFVDEAVQRGCAYGGLGEPEAGMGVTIGDVDGDGDFDLLVAHLAGESNTLYINQGKGIFEDRTARSGLGVPSVPFTGFGTSFSDLNHDGALDLLVGNGRVRRGAMQPSATSGLFWDDYKEGNLLFMNNGTGEFTDATSLSGSFGSQSDVSRGLALGDVDRDGDVDVLLTNAAGPAQLFFNEFPKQGHWLSVRAVDPTLNRDAIGAVVRVDTKTGSFMRLVHSGASYLSSSDFRCNFGLGACDQVQKVSVTWPDGEEEAFGGCEVNQHLFLSRGSSKLEIEATRRE